MAFPLNCYNFPKNSMAKNQKYRKWQPVMAAPILPEYSPTAERVVNIILHRFQQKFGSSFQADADLEPSTRKSHIIERTLENERSSKTISNRPVTVIPESIPATESDNGLVSPNSKFKELFSNNLVHKAIPVSNRITSFPIEDNQSLKKSHTIIRKLQIAQSSEVISNRRAIVIPESIHAAEADTSLVSPNSKFKELFSNNLVHKAIPISNDIIPFPIEDNQLTLQEISQLKRPEPENITSRLKCITEWVDPRIFESEAIISSEPSPGVPISKPKPGPSKKSTKTNKRDLYTLQVTRGKMDVPVTKQLKLTEMAIFNKTNNLRKKLEKFKFVEREDKNKEEQ